MSRLDIITPSHVQTVLDGLYKDIERRLIASPPGLCPIDMALSFLRLCHAQTCGKCVPCRIGLGQLTNLLEDVLRGEATLETINLIEKSARVIVASADCAIGYEAAEMVLKGIHGFRDDYMEHVVNHRCIGSLNRPVPCVSGCPAEVDIPGYIALIGEGRYKDAIRLIRKDNPFPAVCAFICEHPCENHCRRTMVDAAVNIRGLKRFAVDHAGDVPAPPCAPKTGKRVAVIGGGPSGLSAAYYLSLMGHAVTVFEKRNKLGGMLRYGIPSYRLPRERLEEEIGVILSTGIQVKANTEIGDEKDIDELRRQFDAVYISIGAHTDKKLGIEGEDKRGVISAIQMLRAIGDGSLPDFKGKKVAIIGGGNVAMDVTRTAMRLGAESVTCVYRRRQEDMTALPEEVEGAIAEGCEIATLLAPVRIESDADENAVALWAHPQMVGKIDESGRPVPMHASAPEKRIPADIIVVAIGQRIESARFAAHGLPVHRGKIEASSQSAVGDIPAVYAGGDCVTGPATVIRAIAAGKVAAANIDEFLGFNHTISTNVEIPVAYNHNHPPCGRNNLKEREAAERKKDFEAFECGMRLEEAQQECSRCLRCDHFGYGVFKGGRRKSW